MSTLESPMSHIAVACEIWFCPVQERTSRELHQLSQVEREKVWADMSGDECLSTFEIIKEDSEVVAQCLREMDDEISITSRKEAFLQAQGLAPGYVNSEPMRTKFLRSEMFNPKAAAARIIRHFEVKKNLFGEDKLGRDILLSDLTEEGDMEALSCGGGQFLREADKAGRRVYFSRYVGIKYKSRKNITRVLWYSTMAMAEDEQVQKLGIVRIMYILDGYPPGGVDYEMLRLVIKVWRAVPIRGVALYTVSQQSIWDHTIDIGLLMADPFTRLRTRAIHGSFSECMYALMCLGLPYKSLPVGADGQARIGNHHQWIRERERLEGTTTCTSN